ncbi:MAG: hypothetical protein WCL23_04240 [Candidatus Moraniibacteriota bacterium]
MFGKKTEKISMKNAELSPDQFHGVHTMQDDLDELSGLKPSAAAQIENEPTLPRGGNEQSPFLSDSKPFPPIVSEGRIEISDRKSERPESDILSMQVEAAPKRPVAEPVLIINESASAEPTSRERSWVLPIAGLGLLALVGGAAGYLYLFGGLANQNPPVTEPVLPQPEVVQPEVQPTNPESAYVQGMPNYATIDIESPEKATPAAIKSQLAETDAAVLAAKPSFPVEFVIRDTSNNPIAFSRFAYLLGLKLPANTVAAFDEGFSIYFVTDGNTVRRILSVKVKAGRDMMKLLLPNEKSLVPWFGPMIYGTEVTTPAGVAFKNGTYGTLSTRFVNIEVTGATSLDYTVFNDKLVVGSSKDSFRSVLGSLVSSK